MRPQPFVRECFTAILLLVGSHGVASSAVTVSPGEPWPALAPGSVVHLGAGVFEGPWEIDVPGVVINANGATLRGPTQGSALVLLAPKIVVRNLQIEDAGSVADLYAPDAAVWMLGCDACRLENVATSGTPGGVRIEASQAVTLQGVTLRGTPEGPGVTAYLADGLTLTDGAIHGFLDGVYVERSDDVRIAGMTVLEAARFGLHVMFGDGLEVVGSTVSGGGVGSAVMYGRRATVQGNRFLDHVGPLSYGLLIHEMDVVAAENNILSGNTVGALIVSAHDVTLANNQVTQAGTGVVVQRTPSEVANHVRLTGNRFAGNVADVAVDDPEARVALRGNAFDRASRLDRDQDGVSDAAFLPTSTFALLQTRQPDVSLFARSPGVVLWEAAEASVPGLRMARLHDPAPEALSFGAQDRMPASGWVAVLAVMMTTLGVTWSFAIRRGVRKAGVS